LREPFGPAVRASWSDDGGRRWQAFASEPPEGEGAGSIALTADGSGVLWAPRNAKHVWLTRDFGHHWQVAAGLPGGVNVLGDRFDAQRCYAFDAKSGALFVSHDGGASFAPLAGALGAAARGHDHVQLQASPDAAGELYLAARDLLLLRGEDGGKLQATLPGIDGVDAFGFGKSAPGGHQSTLFVAGRLSDSRGSTVRTMAAGTGSASTTTPTSTAASPISLATRAYLVACIWPPAGAASSMAIPRNPLHENAFSLCGAGVGFVVAGRRTGHARLAAAVLPGRRVA